MADVEHGAHTQTRRGGVLPTTDAEERRYHLAMASLMADRGYTNLAESHLLHVRDCPRGCGCAGCVSTRAEAEERRKVKALRRRAA